MFQIATLRAIKMIPCASLGLNGGKWVLESWRLSFHQLSAHDVSMINNKNDISADEAKKMAKAEVESDRQALLAIFFCSSASLQTQFKRNMMMFSLRNKEIFITLEMLCSRLMAGNICCFGSWSGKNAKKDSHGDSEQESEASWLCRKILHVDFQSSEMFEKSYSVP